MKMMVLGSTAILSLLLATATPALSQQERREEGKDRPEQQQRGKQEQGRPESQHQPAQRPAQPRAQQPQQRAAQPQRQEHEQPQRAQQQRIPQPPQQAQQQRRQPTQRTPQEQQHARQQQVHQPAQRAQQQRIQRSAWQQHGSQHWESDHRTWQQRGGYHGYRIPDNRYRGYFGPSHAFLIRGLPFQVIGGYPRFQYQGYWISTVDPWPESWGNDWYDNDDVYVNYVEQRLLPLQPQISNSGNCHQYFDVRGNWG